MSSFTLWLVLILAHLNILNFTCLMLNVNDACEGEELLSLVSILSY